MSSRFFMITFNLNFMQGTPFVQMFTSWQLDESGVENCCKSAITKKFRAQRGHRVVFFELSKGWRACTLFIEDSSKIGDHLERLNA